MRTVQLSKHVILGAVALNWRSSGFPESIYIALETVAGVSESCGGVGCGSVVNAAYDLESGHFFDMARIDELVLNIPSREVFEARLGVEHEAFWREYPWQFAQVANGTRIEWE